MKLPIPRGPLTETLCAALAGGEPPASVPAPSGDDPLTDGDLQLALWLLYQLHYDGFDGVDRGREWDPDLIRVRLELEERLLDCLRDRTADLVAESSAGGERGDPLPDRLFAMTDRFDGPSVASYLQRDATADQFLEMLAHRSLYTLRETDPQVFAMPRLCRRAQVAMAELVYDEYGGGRPDRMHSRLFAQALADCGLDATPGGYVDSVPATTLALTNVMHLFALRSELAPASAGHFGAFEATSSVPSRQLVSGAERLELPDSVRDYYDEHVEADAVHEQLAFRDICGSVVDDDPAAEPLVLLGAASCLVVEAVAGEAMLAAWQAGASSLQEPGSSGKVA
jgi:hypothetical protein